MVATMAGVRVRLRSWQHRALLAFNASRSPDFLAVATPGAGKTNFALVATRQVLSGSVRRRLVVVTPTVHLKGQWAAAASRMQLHLDPSWAASNGSLARDMHGAVLTYAQVASSAAAVRKLAAGAFVVLDEVHHGAHERAWGESLLRAFGAAHRRLGLSGTPFRSDVKAIPFVRYDDSGEAQPDFEYGYGQALHDGGVVRPIYFPAVGGHMEWTTPKGARMAATFDDELDVGLHNQRLRTALSLEGDWLPDVLGEAIERLAELRQHQHSAGGLIIASDQAHAHGVADLLANRFGLRRPAVAVSDDPEASRVIGRFALSSEPWLVAVRMVSEGVDIPRLRVGVYATPTTTELFFRQAVGRFVRWQAEGPIDQRAWLYLPDDARLRWAAARLTEARRHWIAERFPPRVVVGDDDEDLLPYEDMELDAAQQAELERLAQMSLFSPLSAVRLDTESLAPWLEVLPSARPDGIDWELPPLPEGDADDVPEIAPGGSAAARTRSESKDALRKTNAKLAGALARKSGLPHATVNNQLNRAAGIRRVSTATLEQLQRRIAIAYRWLDA